VKAPALAPHLLLVFGVPPPGLLYAAEVARICDPLPLCSDQQDCEPYVDAGFSARWGQRL